MPEWPFVGRTSELAGVDAGLRGRGAVVLGSAGVGKSRLVEQALSRVDQTGHALVRVFGTAAASGIPLGAFAAVLPQENRLGQSLRRDIEALRAMAGARRLVLAVDDAHLLDETSIALLEQLLLHEGAAALLSMRTEAVEAPLRRFAGAEGFARVEVAELTAPETSDLLRTALDGPVLRLTARRIFAATKGVPLLIRALLQAGLASGSLRRSRGGWEWLGELVVDAQLAEIVEVELGALSTSERHLSELLAFGEPLSMSLLTKLTGEELVESMEARGIVRVRADQADPEVWLGHPIYAEVIRAGCPELRTFRRQRELAEAVFEAESPRRGDFLRAAVWLLDGGSAAPADFWLGAAGEAWSTLDTALTTRLARRAVAGGGGIDAIEKLAESLIFGDGPPEAEDMLTELAEAAVEEADRDRLVYWRAVNLLMGLGDGAAADRVLSALSGSDPAVRLLRCYIDTCTVRTTAALASTRRLLADRNAGAGVHLEAAVLRAQTLLFRGRHLEAAELIDREVMVDQEAAVSPWFWHVRGWVRAGAHLAGLALAETEHTAVSHLDSSRTWNADTHVWAAIAARAARLAGRVEDALRWSLEGSGAAQTGSVGAFDAMCLAEVAHAYGLLGRAEEAEAALAIATTSRRDGWLMVGLDVDIAAPWVAAAAGDLERAARLAIATAGRTRRLGASHFEAIALHDVARLTGRATAGSVARLADLAARLDGAEVRVYAAHASALRDRDPAGLERVAVEFEGLGLMLYAAEAEAAAGLTYERDGGSRQAKSAWGRAHRLRLLCQSAHTPVLDEVPVHELSVREREVARLVAEGLSNREVAERLQVSRRTVENQLYEVYAKLGITDRSDLPARLEL